MFNFVDAILHAREIEVLRCSRIRENSRGKPAASEFSRIRLRLISGRGEYMTSRPPQSGFCRIVRCSSRGTFKLLLVLSSTIAKGCGDMLIATSNRVLKDAMQESWRSLTGIRKRETFFPEFLSHHGNLSRIFCFF